jgi:hypothetical protein
MVEIPDVAPTSVEGRAIRKRTGIEELIRHPLMKGLTPGTPEWKKMVKHIYYENHQDEFLDRNLKSYYQDRDFVYKWMGQQCSCCNERDFDVLTIDHVNEDGAEWRASNKTNPATIIRAMIAKGLPIYDFDLLCRNCNQSKHVGHGVCVHRR